MKYFAVLLPLLDKAKSDQFRPQHLSFLESMRNEGHVIANGRFTDGTGGLVIYKANSYEECETLVQQDPFIKEEARRYEIREWDAVFA